MIVRGQITSGGDFISAYWADKDLRARVDGCGCYPTPPVEAVFDRYSETFRHPDVHGYFPDVLRAFKNPDIQNVLNAVVINHFVREPGYIRAFYPDIDESLITLLTTDNGFRALFEDEAFQDVLQDPTELDALVRLIEAQPPLHPEILALDATFTSITERNQDSGAPQGTVTISAYTTTQRTVPQVTAIRLSAGSAGSWEVKISTQVGGRIKWSVTVNTMTLPDTVTKANPGARNAVLDNRKYTVFGQSLSARTERNGPLIASPDSRWITLMMSLR